MEKFIQRCHIFFPSAPTPNIHVATTKNAHKWMIVIQPSIRSKLDQRLRIGLTPKRSAIRATTTNRVIETLSGVNFGLYFASRNAKMIHDAKATSTTMRKKKALPVINGKKYELATTRGNRGTRNRAM